MTRQENPVGKYLWVPTLLTVALLAINLVQGTVFDPRTPRPPKVDPRAAAAAGDHRGSNDGSKAASATAMPDLAAQDERLGGVLSSSSESEEARKKVEGIRSRLQVNPKDYQLHYELGNALYDAGDPSAAISAYKKAIEINEKFVKAYVNLGETLRERGDLKESISTLEKAISIDAKNDIAHAALGFAYYTEKRYPDAMHEFDRALTLNPRSVHATYYMGMAFADAQIYREAIKWWDKVCEIDPNSDACLEARENNQLLRQIVK